MKYAYWLANSLSNAKILHLREAEDPEGVRTAEMIWNMSKDELERVRGLNGEDVERLVSSRSSWNPEEKWQELQEAGISFTCLERADYPQKLRTIHDAPFGVYYTGRLPDEHVMQIAMVGARGRSTYGSEVAHELARELGSRGVQIISGLAVGIDTDSHRGCLDGNGSTFAVLGCGVDVCYPRQNAWLYPKICEKGGILSEYPPGTPAIARQFPARNRIISGLSDKVVVLEARQKSGSLITADFAIEQGRDVYALPGRITDSLSQGTNRLIRQGAGTIVSIEDFLKEIDLDTGTICTQLDFRKNLLEKEEVLVYSLLDFQPTGLGTLLTRSAFGLSELLADLEHLKDLGFVRECNPNYFVKTL